MAIKEVASDVAVVAGYSAPTVLLTSIATFVLGTYVRSWIESRNRQKEHISTEIRSLRIELYRDEIWPSIVLVRSCCSKFDRESESDRKSLSDALVELENIRLRSLPFLTSIVNNNLTALMDDIDVAVYDPLTFSETSEHIDRIAYSLRSSLDTD